MNRERRTRDRRPISRLVKPTVLLGLVALLALAGTAGSRSRSLGRDLHLRYPAPLLGQSGRDVRVYLPRSYNLGTAPDRRYPVVYLLHGFPGRAGDWLGRGKAGAIADTLAAAGAIPEVILVCPDGNHGFFGRSLWSDRWDGTFPLARSFITELVPWVDSTFRTRPDAEHRALIGLSDGATGGLNLLLDNPDEFSAWGGHSGEYRLQMNFGMRGVIGPRPEAEVRLRAMSPLETISDHDSIARARALYFDCGSEDESLAGNRELHERLDSLGVAHEWQEFPGSHTWDYWRQHLPGSLVAVCGGMRTESAPLPSGAVPGACDGER